MDTFLQFVTIVGFVAALLWCLRPRRFASLSHPLKQTHPKIRESQPIEIDTTPDRPVGFGYKMSWLAVKANDAETVLQAISIQDLEPANWLTGIASAYDGRTFVSPSINGWVAIVSLNLPELGAEESADQWNSLMFELSTKFEDVQYFSNHRVVGYCAWARFIDEKEIRAFAYLGERGEILADRSNPTDEEMELDFDYLDSERFDDGCDDEEEDICFPEEDHVMEVAGAWSINPIEFDERELPGRRWLDWQLGDLNFG